MPREQIVNIGGDWVDGMLVGRQAALAEWRLRKEIDDDDFVHLVWRLQARKYWKAKNPTSRARILEYRRQWRLQHIDRFRASVRAAKLRRRADPLKRAHDNAMRRQLRASKSAERRAALVYTCVVCGAQWSKPGRIPPVPPKYCSQSCRGKANYARGKAQGKAWAMRDKAHRRDRE